jgi:hypothetical protein
LRYCIEALLGIAIAALLAWSILASTTDIPFVYQGF